MQSIFELTLGLVAFRTAPYVCWSFLDSEITWMKRLLCFGAYTVLIIALVALSTLESVSIHFIAITTAYLYFAFASTCFYIALSSLKQVFFGKTAIFFVAIFGCNILPALFFNSSAASMIAVVGFEVTLSLYSFCMESTKEKKFPSLKESLFFILVNPVVLYSQRGIKISEPQFRWKAVRRCAFGIATIIAGVGVIQLIGSLPEGYIERDIIAIRDVNGFAKWLVFYSLLAFSVYWPHSGRASLEIGLMRLLGYKIPERYDSVYRSDGLLDFWRRWNTYIGSWLRVYLFFPLAIALGRLRRNGSPRWAKATALLLTFTACGLLHDYNIFVETYNFGTAVTRAFVVQGIAVLLWIGVSSAWRQMLHDESSRPSRLAGTIAWSFKRVVVYQVLVLTGSIMITALSTT